MAEAQRRGWIVQGNDVVPEVVAGLARDGFTAHVGSLPEISAPVGSCDVITSFCVLPHHLVDPLPDMYAAQQMLSPGGWFILQLPDNGPYRKIAHWAYRLTRGRTGALLAQINQPNGHQFAFDRKNLTLLLEKCGFSVERIDDYFLPPHWSTVRFARRPWWIRIPATAAVHVVYGVSRALKQPNHMFVYARKPAVPQVASAESRP
jgi:SAM-dependent methyltransferase